jgi:hypothetical protein
MTQNLIRAELKGLYSPDTPSLEDFDPDGPFGILVQAMIGPLNDRGEESFDIMVCTPEWLAATMIKDNKDMVSGRHYLLVRRYDYRELKTFLQDYCTSCQGKSWQAVAEKLARIGHWEFEDYVPWAGH